MSGSARPFPRDFGLYQKWKTEFRAMAGALSGGSGWAFLTYVLRDGSLINQYASEHSRATAGAIPVLAPRHVRVNAYHIDFGANAMAYIDIVFPQTSTGPRSKGVSRMQRRWRRRGRWCRRSLATCRASASRKSAR